MSLTQWREIAGHGSQTKLTVEPGVSWAAQLGVLEFDGPDAAKFLQGYLTCDTEALPADRWLPTALCNLKGRVVANGWVGTSPAGTLWLLVHETLTDACLEFLHKYLVFAKAEGHNRSSELVVLMGTTEPALDDCSARTLVLDQQAADSDNDKLWLGVVAVNQAQERWPEADHLQPSSQLNTALILAHHALVSAASSEQYLPQMLGLADRGAIDFDKGCYLGQEIVARAQHRGAVKRQLVQLQWEQSEPPIEGWQTAELTGETNASVGNIINWLTVADTPDTHRGIALAVISAKGDGLPSQVHSPAAPDSTATDALVFQVSKFEN